MNRILRRPMFRMGGSAEGITSGLDAPNINASRKGYKEGSTFWDYLPSGDFDVEFAMKEAAKNKNNNDVVIEQEQDIENMPARSLVAPTYSQDNSISYNDDLDAQGNTAEIFETQDTSGINSINTKNESLTEKVPNDLESRIMDDVTMREKLYDKYGVGPEKEAMAPGSVSSMLMNFGLNLLAQPGGNLMGAIGKAGAPALEKFQAARMSERLSEGKRKREMIDEAIRGQYGLEEERISAQGAIDEALVKAQGKDEQAFKFQAQFKQITDTRQKIRDLQKDVAAGKDPDGSKAAKIEDLNEALTNLVGIDPILKAIYESEWMSGQIDDITDNFEAENDRQPTIDEVLKIIKARGKKDGGRIGYEMGGDVIEEVSETIDTGPAQTQDLTYMELRSRLPREIGNDIVQLLAASKQALMDFANIQTQQDVDNFNQSYNVDLVLPQEG